MMRFLAATLLVLLAAGIVRPQPAPAQSSRTSASPWRIFTPENSPFPERSLAGGVTMALDTHGVGWIAAKGVGALRFDGTTWSAYDTLGISEVLTVDSSNGVWFRIDGGVARLSRGVWQTFLGADSASGLTPGILTALRNIGPTVSRPHLAAGTDLYGTVWFNCRDSLVSYNRDSASWKLYRVTSGPSFGELASMVVRMDGLIFMGKLAPDAGHMRIYNPELRSWTIRDAKSFGFDSSDTFTPVAGDRRGNIWFEVSHHPGGITDIARYYLGGNGPTRIQAQFNTLTAIDVDAKAIYWVATPGGLMRTMSERYTMRNSPLPADSIADVLCDHLHNIVWALTRDGLAQLDATAPFDSTFTRVGGEPAAEARRPISLRPTTTSGPVTIAVDPGVQGRLRLSVTSLLGRTVLQVPDREPGDERGSMQLDLSSLPPGRYFVRAVAGDRVETVPVDVVR